MFINLEQDHIDEGLTGHAACCPVALCLRENLELIGETVLKEVYYDDDVLVYRNQIWIGDHRFTPSDELYHWIETFDRDPKSVEPVMLDIDDYRIDFVH